MKSILAIDDQKDNLVTIKAVIKNNLPDCEVVTALSGLEGIEIARTMQPDAILLDIIMPRMDGYEVCRRLKEDDLTKHIPVVMITAIRTDSESRIKGLNIGADAFLSKPIDPFELSAQVNVMLRIKEAEDKLREEKNNLGKEVLNRTKELEIINEEYRLEILERKRTEQIQKVLFNISNAVSTTDNLNDLIILIQKELGNIIDTSNFYVALYDHKTDMFTVPYLLDEKDEFDSFPAGKTMTNYVLQTQKPFLATKESISELVKSGDVGMHGTDSEVWLGVPLIIEGIVTGVLAVQSYTDENAFDESDLKLLEFVSNQVVLSIHRKKAEDDLVTALAKAKESDRLKSAFLANMSHEIRTPMNGILGFAELLKEPDLSSVEVRNYVRVIESSGDRMLSTINDLIDISKIEAGQMEVVVSMTIISELTNELFSFFKPETEKKGLQLHCKNTLSGKEATINTDKEKLYAILTNLIKNSIKYTHKGSIEFGYQVKGRFVEFFVKDTGIGIATDRQVAIFERFVQADLGKARAFEGAGLGLSITKAYVDMLGGEIRLESIEGKGSQFYFTIPYNTIMREQEAGKDLTDAEGAGREVKKLKILIAEDDEVAELHLSTILKGMEREIFHARTGKEAIEFCRSNPDTDLVLMDIKMPEIDGHEAVRKIREFNKKIVIVAQTAYALEGDREQALAAGCNDYIAKPIKKVALLAIVESYFDFSKKG
ncbi:MAG: response regulator [Bacteroidota bacterium]|nr:response regulator [Bacteroidota bacterium]